MSAVDVMAFALRRELQARGIFRLDLPECTEIVKIVMAQSAAIAEESKQPLRRGGGNQRR
jgi:hypothetical protein